MTNPHAYDTVVVGAGDAGSITVERLASQCRHCAPVADRREHGAVVEYPNPDQVTAQALATFDKLVGSGRVRVTSEV